MIFHQNHNEKFEKCFLNKSKLFKLGRILIIVFIFSEKYLEK
jgi:hypothetical protein